MKPDSVVAALLTGTCPDAPVWEINKAVRTIVDGIALDRATYVAAGIWKATNTLNRALHFELSRLIGQEWAGSRDFHAGIARNYAQSLINLSFLDEADDVLDHAMREVGKGGNGVRAEPELTEYQGLKARLCKQRFVNDGDINYLVQAFDRYCLGYAASKETSYWLAINAIALLARAERDGVACPSGRSSAQRAARLLRKMPAALGDDVWLMATMSELCLALGKMNDAELWLYRLMHLPGCDAFVLNSFARQLKEIWGGRALDGGNSGADRLASIVAKHQMSRFAVLAFDPPKTRHAQDELELNFSGAGSFSIDALTQILQACSAIGCVCNKAGCRLGTGFLVEASTLGLEHRGKVFVTNAHVLSNEVEGALRPAEGLVSFEMACIEGKPVFHKIEKILFTSPPGSLGQACSPCENLDVTVVQLEQGPSDCAGLSLSAYLPIVDGDAKAYVIGHPRGSGLQVSVHDSELLAVDEASRLLHYRTPTDPGSSGSPVFNEQWKVIALHHGGSSCMPRFRPASGVYQANEGVTMQAIREGIRAEFAACAASRPMPLPADHPATMARR